jgi:hypothetical protein
MRKWVFVALLGVGASILGATVLREQLATAAASVLTVNIVSPVDAQGNVKVRQQGVVRTQAALPARSFSATERQSFEEGCDENLPAGTRWVISSFAVTNFSDTRAGATLGLFNPGPGEQANGPQIRVPPHETRQLTFPQPYVFTSPADGRCLLAEGLDTTLVTVVGYRE